MNKKEIFSSLISYLTIFVKRPIKISLIFIILQLIFFHPKSFNLKIIVGRCFFVIIFVIVFLFIVIVFVFVIVFVIVIVFVFVFVFVFVIVLATTFRNFFCFQFVL
jgi:hypothetical protein